MTPASDKVAAGRQEAIDHAKREDGRSDLGIALEESLEEALAWKSGETALETVKVEPTPAERILPSRDG